ncbi:MAG TPA: NGG1p interacting factor NIF3 [Firmicutes bacterium]|nr:NGG1p interacting factor NIF3 [Bacillota bacterium]
MKLKQFYKTAVDFAVKNDPRGVQEVKAYLKTENKKYAALSPNEKAYYDEEKLTNPYADSRILYDSGKEIKSILVGIDMEVGELLLAERLSEKGRKIDAVITHHPEGMAYARFYDVMDMQADIFSSFGVTISASQGLLEKRIKEVGQKVAASNHYRTADAARLLDIPILSMHTVADNCVASYLQKRTDSKNISVLQDIIDMLMQEPEYKEAAKKGNPPVILAGNKNRKVKKVMVDMTGGTSGPKEIYEKLSNSGVDTIIGMHFSPEHKKELERINMNVVLAGHISSDTLGMNLVLDEVERKHGKLKIYETSGFKRFARK